MLMSTMGMVRTRPVGGGRVARLAGGGGARGRLGAGAAQSLALSSLAAFRHRRRDAGRGGARRLRGDRAGWTAVAGIVFMLVAIAGLSWIALSAPPRGRCMR
jgi:hypothetical protein